jgi:hypothetical protein
MLSDEMNLPRTRILIIFRIPPDQNARIEEHIVGGKLLVKSFENASMYVRRLSGQRRRDWKPRRAGGPQPWRYGA